MRFFAVMVLALLSCRCERRESAQSLPRASATVEGSAAASAHAARASHGQRESASTKTWVYESTAVGPMHVVVAVPAHEKGHHFPVLIALHGRGEAFKGPVRGARGWIDDYGLYHAVDRLARPPLTTKDFGGAVEPARLATLNQALKRHPYQGLIVVCPYTPDLLAGKRAFRAAKPLSDFLVNQVLPRVFKELPATGTPRTTGIDGVSLGGRASLLVGFEHPEAFGVVGALQAAFDMKEIPELVERAIRAKQKNPLLSLRLLTSDADYFLDVNRALSSELQKRGVSHTLTVVRGDHSYEFNRGPGVFEMLTHHDWALRGEPAP